MEIPLVDAFVFLTPILVLGLLLLVRFVGCDVPFSSGDTYAPDDLVATPGDGQVMLTWTHPVDQAVYFDVDVRNETTSYRLIAASADGNVHSTIVDRLDNGIEHWFKLRAYEHSEGLLTSPGNSAYSPEVSATPTSGLVAFVTSSVLGAPRTNDTVWAGMAIQVTGQAITVRQLGRIVSSGNGSHSVRIVEAGSGAVLGVATVVVAGVPGAFAYAEVTPPVTLQPLTAYYIVSREEDGGDGWYDFDTTVTTTAVAFVLSAVYGQGPDGGVVYTTVGGPGQTYGPVDFKY